jgi:hypothetical protein
MNYINDKEIMEINYDFSRILGYLLVSPLFIVITLAVVILLSKKYGKAVALISAVLISLAVPVGAISSKDPRLCCYIGVGYIQVCLLAYSWYHEIYRKL